MEVLGTSKVGACIESSEGLRGLTSYCSQTNSLPPSRGSLERSDLSLVLPDSLSW